VLVIVESATTVIETAAGVVVVVSGPSGFQSRACTMFKGLRANLAFLAQRPRLVHLAILVEVTLVTV